MSASHITLVPTPIRSERVSSIADDVRPGTARLRITRRGRIVLGALITLVVVGLLAVAATLGASRAIASNEAGNADFGYVVVQPGDTLWSVATELDPSSDPRDIIAEIVRLNQLSGSDVQAGEAIAVPLRYSDAPGVMRGEELGIDA